jgi:hypothetical protein
VNSGARRVKPKYLALKVARGREAAKWREAVSRPSKEDRWKRSRDLANSGVRRVRAQVLGIQSHEVASSEIPRGKVSELTDHRISGIREPSVQPLNSRSHEFRFPDKSRKGDRAKRTVGADVPIGK